MSEISIGEAVRRRAEIAITQKNQDDMCDDMCLRIRLIEVSWLKLPKRDRMNFSISRKWQKRMQIVIDEVWRAYEARGRVDSLEKPTPRANVDSLSIAVRPSANKPMPARDF